MAVEVILNTPLADALSNVVQPKLVDVGWSTGGLDDSALAEYIILMLVNGKTQEQIASELSNDLLNLGPDDSGATDFSSWLFEQVEILHNQLNGRSIPQATTLGRPLQGQPMPSHAEYERPRSRRGSRQSGSAGSQDAEMGDAVDGDMNGAIPTGPRSMRNGRPNNNKRLIGQLSKAMDRTNDAVLHRVRPHQGTERINTHQHPRQPPTGPRAGQARPPRLQSNGRPTGMPNGVMANGGPPGAMMQMTPQQQMQLFAMYEEQARMMSQILSPQQQQMFMPGAVQPAINPAFRPSVSQQGQQAGRSLFERVESNPQRPNGHLARPPHLNGKTFHANSFNGNAVDGQPSTNGDLTSSMEVESSQTTVAEPSADTLCKYNLSCTKKDCPFAHQSPAAPPGITVDVNDRCPFGAACKNRKCVASHPSPAQKPTHQAEQECKFFPNCTNTSCPFRHPTMPMCRNGADCSRTGCKFTHVKTMCKYNPCLNPGCPYKHVEGQKRGAFDDKVWVANGSEKQHVSERKFIGNPAAEEELVVPENFGGSQSSSLGAEVVT